MSPSFLLLGLGNPGERYAGTRHNVGFDAVDEIAGSRGQRFRRPVFRPLSVSVCTAIPPELVLAKPLTYMNRSGVVVPWLLHKYRCSLEQFCVIVDNMDLPPGEFRMKKRGGPSGHNGLRSISQALGHDDYPRIYVGVGRPFRSSDIVPHVLGQFDSSERIAVDDALSRLAAVFAPGSDISSIDRLVSLVNSQRRPAGRTGRE